MAGQGPVSVPRPSDPVPVDPFPWLNALRSGTVDFGGTIVVEGQPTAVVTPTGLVRSGGIVIGRVESRMAYRYDSSCQEYRVGSVCGVRTSQHMLVYLYDREEVAIGIMLFRPDTLPPADPELHLRLAGAALICCRRAPASCTGR